MGPSWWQIAVVIALFVLLFGRGKISDVMGDVAKGIKSFKKGLSDDEGETASAAKPAQRIDRQSAPAEQTATREEQKLDS